jgi:hypothetical protein
LLDYLNIVYADIFSRLSAVNKKYTWQWYTVWLVANQSEYSKPQRNTVDSKGNTIAGLKLLTNVFVDYGNWEKECRIYNNLLWDDNEYSDYDNPYVVNRNGSNFLYPIPKETTGTIRVEWKYIPLDLELTTVSTNIKLPEEYHDILILWLNYWILWQLRKYEEQAIMKNAYEEWIQRMINEWWQETESFYLEKEPDLSSME